MAMPSLIFFNPDYLDRCNKSFNTLNDKKNINQALPKQMSSNCKCELDDKKYNSNQNWNG